MFAVLLIHRAERSDSLVAALGDVLATPSADPFTPEVVAVPSAGVERWLAQQLSHVLGAVDGDGVCANVMFSSSDRLLDDAISAADPPYADAVEVWTAERVVWPLMSVIDASVHTETWAGMLAVHLGLDPGGQDRGRRFAVAAKLARHFAAYTQSRPAMLRAWHDGRDEQGDGTPLPDDLRWQAEVWRRVRAGLGPSPAELLDDACGRLRADPHIAGLPDRLSIFGTTRVTASRLAVLTALAEHREIHLWLSHPSPVLWAATEHAGAGSTRRADEVTTHIRNPLLASLSRDIRELQRLLPPGTDVHHADVHHPDVHHAEVGQTVAPQPDTLLVRLQQDLAGDRVPAAPMTVDPADRSLTVHACHGLARQVEVVREVILGLLAADPTLEPRDIVIMCPDVETIAPLVAASFGMLDEPGGHPAARLRVRLADRSLRQTNPLFTLLGQLLELAANRVTATQVLDLAGAQPVRDLFGFTDDDLERLREWTASANARWGLDAQHRSPYGLGTLAQGTWRAALDRMLLGITMEESDRWLGPVLPLDDVDSNDIDLVGRVAELLDRVDAAVRLMEQPHTVAAWMTLLGELIASLGAAGEPWQALQLRGELADIAEAASDTHLTVGRADVAALLRARLAGRPTRASFRTGTLTVCTLVPMRSVPHRVVCLVGLDDGAFPRQSSVDGDDVLARDPWIGERDVRSEDRQLFLDAICAAQQTLVVTYTGADPRTGAEVPPCVPLGELLDAVDATVRTVDGSAGREHVLVRQPLQPFDARNFTPQALGTPAPFSFDTAALAAARAGAGDRHPPVPLVTGPLAAAAPTPAIDLEDLVRFLQHPVRGFLRQRLGISTYDDEDEPADALSVDLDGLQTWGIGDRVLRNCLAGMSPQTCAEIERRRGDLPPGELGRTTLRTIGANVGALLAACALEREHPPRSIDVTVRLADGRLVSGTVGGVRDTTVLSVGYSTLAPKHRIAAWVRHLALVAGTGDPGFRSVTVGRRSTAARRTVVGGVDAATARQVLAALVAVRDAGLREPLPLPLATGCEYAERRHRGDGIEDALVAARKKWSGDRFANENAEPEHVLAFGGVQPLEALLAARDTTWPGETTRFAALARQVWTPLLSVEIDVRP